MRSPRPNFKWFDDLSPGDDLLLLGSLEGQDFTFPEFGARSAPDVAAPQDGSDQEVPDQNTIRDVIGDLEVGGEGHDPTPQGVQDIFVWTGPQESFVPDVPHLTGWPGPPEPTDLDVLWTDVGTPGSSPDDPTGDTCDDCMFDDVPPQPPPPGPIDLSQWVGIEDFAGALNPELSPLWPF